MPGLASPVMPQFGGYGGAGYMHSMPQPPVAPTPAPTGGPPAPNPSTPTGRGPTTPVNVSSGNPLNLYPNVHALHPALALVDKKTLVWIGKIDPGIEDDIVQQLIELCGPFDTWKRASDPQTGQWRKFGFCEFHSAEGALRAFRLLNEFPFGPAQLTLKVEGKIAAYLKEYQGKRKDIMGMLPANDKQILEEGKPFTDEEAKLIKALEADPEVRVDELRRFESPYELHPATKKQNRDDRIQFMKIKKLVKDNRRRIPTFETQDIREISLSEQDELSYLREKERKRQEDERRRQRDEERKKEEERRRDEKKKKEEERLRLRDEKKRKEEDERRRAEDELRKKLKEEDREKRNQILEQRDIERREAIIQAVERRRRAGEETEEDVARRLSTREASPLLESLADPSISVGKRILPSDKTVRSLKMQTLVAPLPVLEQAAISFTAPQTFRFLFSVSMGWWVCRIVSRWRRTRFVGLVVSLANLHFRC
eukprot:TRINITY_DN1786_c0_g1_i1.p1 TRINITY_DN1786_c0_g1~~TRINITY_DN1786_c0_g1_i1.p1  ORF type:complete len:534 (+),score=100.11 TRINITY_DN1786_c0_g1_i1:156-1604(+)